MKLRPNYQRVKTLIEDTVLLLCKNGIEYDQEFSVDALVVISVDNHTTFHASVKEKVHKQAPAPESAIPEPMNTEVCIRTEANAPPIASPNKGRTSDVESHSGSRVGLKRKNSSLSNDESPPAKVVIKQEPVDSVRKQTPQRQTRNSPTVVIGTIKAVPTPSNSKKQQSKESDEHTTKDTKKTPEPKASVISKKSDLKDKKEETPPQKRQTRSSTPVVIVSEETTTTPSTRRSNRLSTEPQTKVQTRGASTSKTNPSPPTEQRETRQRKASVAASPVAKPTTRRSENATTPSKKNEPSVKENGKVADKNEVKKTVAKTTDKNEVKMSVGKTTEKKNDTNMSSKEKVASVNKEQTLKAVETVSIDTRGVQIIRKPSTSQEKNSVANDSSDKNKPVITKLKSSSEQPILTSSKDFMRISLKSANPENRLKQNGHESQSPKSPRTPSSPSKQSHKRTQDSTIIMQALPNPLGLDHAITSPVLDNDIDISGSHSLTQSQINEVVQKVMNIDPSIMKCKGTASSTGMIKVNVGLKGQSRTICKTTKPIIKQESGPQDGGASGDSRVGNVYRCPTCQMMFMRAENYHKHMATH